ncbi:MAG TPA: CoA-binding protein [bacterium]|nr:CoA-binding protein [bacterium]
MTGPDDEARAILSTARTIAVVGLSNKPDRPSFEVAAYLQAAGYRIIPVNPMIDEALGERAYARLRDIPERVDVVQIFRRPEDVPAVVDEAIEIGAGAVWMQPGAEHEGAAEKARRAGLRAVVGACMMVTHRRLLG